MANETNKTNKVNVKPETSATPDERLEGWEGLASEEASSGTLAPSDALEEALREASEAVGQSGSPRPGGVPGSNEMLLEAVSSELLTLNTEYESAQQELAELRDQHIRLQAEFENFRRRGLKERQETQLYGHQNLVKELLPTVDNLDRAIEHAEQSSSEELQQLLQGVELVRKELLGVLDRFGVTQIEADGAVFDPAVHEAMAQTPSAEVPPNTVVAVMEQGYQLRDRMLRPARVVVSTGVAGSSEPKPESEQ